MCDLRVLCAVCLCSCPISHVVLHIIKKCHHAVLFYLFPLKWLPLFLWLSFSFNTVFIIHRYLYYFIIFVEAQMSSHTQTHTSLFVLVYKRLSWDFYAFCYIMYPCCGFFSCPQVTIGLYNKQQTACKQKRPPNNNMVIIVVCDLPDYLGFYPSLCNIWVQAECGRRAEVIGQ